VYSIVVQLYICLCSQQGAFGGAGGVVLCVGDYALEAAIVQAGCAAAVLLSSHNCSTAKIIVVLAVLCCAVLCAQGVSLWPLTLSRLLPRGGRWDTA
jgi:hypothetical protein